MNQPSNTTEYRTSWGAVGITAVISLALVALMGYAAFCQGSQVSAAGQGDRQTALERVQKVGSVTIGAAPAAAEESKAADAAPAAAEEAKAADAAPAAAEETADAAPAVGGTTLDMEAGQKLYKSTCDMCHGAGVGGAPRLGNKDDWAPRIAAGMDSMMNIALNGKGGMPKRGTAPASVSDDVLRAAVQYMADSAK